MPKLPPLSAREVVRALQRLGFEQHSQSGSHIKMRRGSSTCIVPLHKELKRGTLHGILKQAKLSAEDLKRGLAQ